MGNKITLRLKGLPEDDGDIRFNDFIQQLENLKKVLIETRKLISDEDIAYFKVVELTKNSPAKIVLEAVATRAEYVSKSDALINNFFAYLNQIEIGILPEGFTNDTYQAYKELTYLEEKQHRLSEIGIGRNDDEPRVLTNLTEKIEKIVGNDEYEYGSATGLLQAINIHNQNLFYIYPINAPKLKCVFSGDIKPKVIEAIDKFVTVYGLKKFRPRIADDIPYEMVISEIDIHKDEKLVKRFSDFRGIAPDITGNETSDDYVMGVRDEW
jgi:hypothetical protein